LLDTLPERLALAQTGGLGHAEFLELVLADEVMRRETTSADRRARAAGLDPAMTLDRWDDTTKITYDRAIWNELCSLRFVDGGHNAVIMGPVGVGKTFLATALGHAAVRRRYSVYFEPCDRLLKRLRASRLDNSHDTEMRKLLRVDLLIVDDFVLQPLDPLDPADVYELIVERHRAAATVVTSNREPVEWLGYMADPLLAQSAIDRLQSAAHELGLDGESYRQRQKPTVTPPAADGLDPAPATRRTSAPPTVTHREPGPMPLALGWSHHAGARHSPACSTVAVPVRWGRPEDASDRRCCASGTPHRRLPHR
jgi:DNA replication protein DnaC